MRPFPSLFADGNGRFVFRGSMVMKTDVHTHSTFSPDGRASLSDMVAAAHAKGLSFYGVSEHFDYEFDGRLMLNEKPAQDTDGEAYVKEARRLQDEYRSKLRFLIGAEFGYSDHAECQAACSAFYQKFHPDFIVNSVHSCDGVDCWFYQYFVGKEKERAYRQYLETVLRSLDAAYHYDIVGHLGYVARNAPYDDKKLRYQDFRELIDEILKGIIARDKILEVNTSVRSAGGEFLPDTDVLERYFELGGHRISFGSDAHDTNRIADKHALVMSTLRKIGFTFLTVPAFGTRFHVPIPNEDE